MNPATELESPKRMHKLHPCTYGFLQIRERSDKLYQNTKSVHLDMQDALMHIFEVEVLESNFWSPGPPTITNFIEIYS
jgi:hypothetical protein